jgi:hypothetical protein
MQINPNFIFRTMGPHENSIGSIYFIVVNFIFFFVYPALIDSGSIKKAMKRNFLFIKKDFIRVILINFFFAFLNFLMRLPFIIVGYQINTIFIVFSIIINLIDFLFLKSMKILVVTRAYNSILFGKEEAKNHE